MSNISTRSAGSSLIRISAPGLILLLLVLFAAAMGGGTGGSGGGGGTGSGGGGGSGAGGEIGIEQVSHIACSSDPICVLESGVTMTMFMGGPLTPDQKWVGYVTDVGAAGGNTAFITPGAPEPTVFDLPTFPEQQAGLEVAGGFGLFPTSLANGVRITLRNILNERTELVEEYRRTAGRITVKEGRIKDEIASEEGRLVAVFSGGNRGEPNPSQYESLVSQTSSTISSLKADIAGLTSLLQSLRSDIDELTNDLEAIVEGGEAFDHNRCPIIDIDIRLPITDPVGNSREVLVEDQNRETAVSNPCPVIALNVPTKTSISIASDGKATVPISGEIRDGIADVVEGDAANITAVKVFLDNALVTTLDLSASSDTASLRRPFAKKFSFSSSVEVQLTPHNGRRVIHLETSPNLIGNTGAATFGFVAFASHSVSSGPGYFKVNPISILVVDGNISSTTVDNISVHVDASTHDGGAPILVETGLSTSTFSGTVPELGFVTVHVTSFQPTTGETAGSMTVELSSSVRGVTNLQLTLTEMGPREQLYFDVAAQNTSMSDLPVTGYEVMMIENGGRTGPGSCNPFYVRVYDPRGAGFAGTFGGQSFSTVVKPELYGEIYFDKTLMRVKKAPTAAVPGILGPGTPLTHQYFTCLRSGTNLGIAFGYSGAEVNTFQGVAAEFIDAMVSSQAQLSPSQRAANRTMLAQFAFGVSGAGNATLRGITEAGQVADAIALTGKPVLVVEGGIHPSSRAFLSQILDVVDEDRVLLKRSNKEFVAEQIKLCCTKPEITDLAGGGFIPWKAEDIHLGETSRDVRVTISLVSDSQAADRAATGLVVLINGGGFNPFDEAITVDPSLGTMSLRPGEKSRIASFPRVAETRDFQATISGEDLRQVFPGAAQDDFHKEFMTFETITRNVVGFFSEEQVATRQDSEAFALGLLKRNWGKNGEALYQAPDVPAKLLSPVSDDAKRWFHILPSTIHVFRSAGYAPLTFAAASKRVEYIATFKGVGEKRVRYEFAGVERYCSNMADVLYYSGHGYHEQAAIGVAPEPGAEKGIAVPGTSTTAQVGSLELDDFWKPGRDIDIFIAAGCSIFDADVTTNPANTTTNSYYRLGPNQKWTKNPGLEWRNRGPRLFLGYRGKAPGDSKGATHIAEQLTEKLPAGANSNDRDAWRQAWLEANLSSKGVTQSDGWKNYAAMDVVNGKYYFLTPADPSVDYYSNDNFTEGNANLP